LADWDELTQLREQAEQMEASLQAVRGRIDQLEQAPTAPEKGKGE
jgi:prefoldin subunit 5